MNFPRISEKKFAGLSLVGSIVIIITTSIWFYQVGPEGFDSTLIAGMLMLVSANLVMPCFTGVCVPPRWRAACGRQPSFGFGI